MHHVSVWATSSEEAGEVLLGKVVCRQEFSDPSLGWQAYN